MSSADALDPLDASAFEVGVGDNWQEVLIQYLGALKGHLDEWNAYLQSRPARVSLDRLNEFKAELIELERKIESISDAAGPELKRRLRPELKDLFGKQITQLSDRLSLLINNLATFEAIHDRFREEFQGLPTPPEIAGQERQLQDQLAIIYKSFKPVRRKLIDLTPAINPASKREAP